MPRLPGPLDAITNAATSAAVLSRAGLVRPLRPDRALSAAVGGSLAAARWGLGLAAGYSVPARRTPRAVALVDDDGPVTFAEMERSTTAIADGLARLGFGPGAVVGLLARNSRSYVQAAVGLAKAGADVVHLNTGAAAPQLAAVLAREGVRAVVADAEFGPLLDEAAPGLARITAYGASPGDRGPHLADLADRGAPRMPLRPVRRGRQIVLTSGTTGTPRGAARGSLSPDAGMEAVVALLERVPLRVEETTVVAAPLFHSWGFAHLGIGMLLGSRLVVSRRFDPAAVLADLDRHRATVLVAVPVMVERLLDVPGVRAIPSLRVIALSGSALPGDLAVRAGAVFGDVLYNLYGSTEAGYISLADPRDLRVSPGTAGRPLRGTVLRVFRPDGSRAAVGEVGALYAGSSASFSGYTDGTDRERRHGLISTGDLGSIDPAGRLTVLGRADDMVVIGGENVHPGPVEDLLATHPEVAEVAVVGEPDERYGARLVAHVVRRGRSAGADPAAELTADELLDWARSRLARYEVPRSVAFLDRLPRNATGKVLRRAL